MRIRLAMIESVLLAPARQERTKFASRVENGTAHSAQHGARQGMARQSKCRSVPCVACYLLSDPVKEMNVKSEACRNISPKRPFFKISVLTTRAASLPWACGLTVTRGRCFLRERAGGSRGDDASFSVSRSLSPRVSRLEARATVLTSAAIVRVTTVSRLGDNMRCWSYSYMYSKVLPVFRY